MRWVIAARVVLLSLAKHWNTDFIMGKMLEACDDALLQCRTRRMRLSTETPQASSLDVCMPDEPGSVPNASPSDPAECTRVGISVVVQI
eukprot:1483336-Amphidinium_carterae.1